MLTVTAPTGDPLEIARRIAESARFDATERVRLPWRLTGVPPELRVSSVMVIEDNSNTPWVAEIAFAGTAADRSGPGPHLAVRTHKGPASPDPNFRPEPNMSVHGFPATLEYDDNPGSEGASLSIYDPDDIVHLIYASASALALLGPGGLAGLAERFELLSEPPTWTDRPLG
jgi:hypothetical protein